MNMLLSEDDLKSMSDWAKLQVIFANRTMLFAFVALLVKEYSEARAIGSHEYDHLVPYIMLGAQVLHDVYGVPIG